MLVLLWLVLFKLSFDIIPVLLEHQKRSLNLIPFGDTPGNVRETIDNLLVFIPFGLLLGSNLKQTGFWQKLMIVGGFSLAVETIQYVFAIGSTDITDLIMNTLGGFIGLALYDFSKKHVDPVKLDRTLVMAGAVLLMALVLYRVLVLQVRY
jgi:glycopeptide antibiotics resistance protein